MVIYSSSSYYSSPEFSSKILDFSVLPINTLDTKELSYIYPNLISDYILVVLSDIISAPVLSIPVTL